MQLQIREFDMRGGDENTTGQRQTWQWVMVFGGRIDYLKERLVSSLLRAPVYRWLGTSGWHWSLRLPQGLWTGWWSLAVLWEKAMEKEKGERVRYFQCAPKKRTLVTFVVEQWGSHLDGKKSVIGFCSSLPFGSRKVEMLLCVALLLPCHSHTHTGRPDRVPALVSSWVMTSSKMWLKKLNPAETAWLLLSEDNSFQIIKCSS